QQGDDGEDPGEGDLQPRSVLVEALILRDCLLGARHVAEDFWVHRAADHQQQRRGGCESGHPPPRTRVPSPPLSTTTSPSRACCDTEAGGGSTPRPTNRPAAASTCPVLGSYITASVR